MYKQTKNIRLSKSHTNLAFTLMKALHHAGMLNFYIIIEFCLVLTFHYSIVLVVNDFHFYRWLIKRITVTKIKGNNFFRKDKMISYPTTICPILYCISVVHFSS